MLLAGATAAVGSRGKAEDATTERIVSIENKWLHAKQRSDAGAFMADDFVGINVAGQIESRQDRLNRFQAGPRPPATAVHFEDLKVRLCEQQVAIATGHVVATARGGKAVYTVSFTDVFCYRENDWRAVSAQETLVPQVGSKR